MEVPLGGGRCEDKAVGPTLGGPAAHALGVFSVLLQSWPVCSTPLGA